MASENVDISEILTEQGSEASGTGRISGRLLLIDPLKLALPLSIIAAWAAAYAYQWLPP